MTKTTGEAGKAVERFPANRSGRDYVCGDIHGGWPLLERALSQHGFDSSADRLFCVGDLIDRGEESARFPEYLDAPWFHAVLGNHEQMALRAWFGEDPEAQALWWMNGGGWVLDLDRDSARRDIGRLDGLPLALEVEGFGDDPVVIVHAGIPGNDWPAVRESLQRQRPDPRETAEPVHTLLWERARLSQGDDSVIAGARHLFHGHTVVDRVVRLGNRTYLDTGSVMTGRLTVLDIGKWLQERA